MNPQPSTSEEVRRTELESQVEEAIAMINTMQLTRVQSISSTTMPSVTFASYLQDYKDYNRMDQEPFDYSQAQQMLQVGLTAFDIEGYLIHKSLRKVTIKWRFEKKPTTVSFRIVRCLFSEPRFTANASLGKFMNDLLLARLVEASFSDI